MIVVLVDEIVHVGEEKQEIVILSVVGGHPTYIFDAGVYL